MRVFNLNYFSPGKHKANFIDKLVDIKSDGEMINEIDRIAAGTSALNIEKPTKTKKKVKHTELT